MQNRLKEVWRDIKFANARMEFSDKRVTFYRDLANYMQAARNVKLTTILANYAERYEGKPIGIMCAHWLSRIPHVGTFTEAVRGTIPDDDLAVIAVSEDAGDLSIGLLNLAGTLDSIKKTKSVVMTVMGTAFAAIIILHAYIAVQAFYAIPKIESSIRGLVDIGDFSGPVQILFVGSSIVRSWWWLWLIVFGGFIGYVIWSLNRLTGRVRRWADEHALPYQLHRVFVSAQLFSTLGSITAPIDSRVLPLRDALVKIRNFASPWLDWQLEQIIQTYDTEPNSGGRIFNSGIVDQETYYRILDISDYSEPAKVFKNISDMMLVSAPEIAEKRGLVIRWVAMITILVVVMGLFGLSQLMTFEFDDLMKLRFAQ